MGDRLRSSRTWRLIVAAAAIVVILGFAFLVSQLATQAQGITQQPIAFNHAVMVKQGITCLFCHADATRSPVAGMPSVQKCMGCHAVIDTDHPEIVKLAAYWQRQEPIPWVRVNQLPRFVYFSHQAHVVAGSLNCETCHGDVSLMAVDQPVVQMNMGWCLSCHEKQANAPQLMECETCHQ